MDKKPAAIYEALLARYGDLNWWPARTPYEVIVGAILTQNTAWGNVELALRNFGGTPKPQQVAALDLDDLKAIIRPAGFFNQKALYLKAVTAWFADYHYQASAIRRQPLEKLRAELLRVKGVGPETADSILLYAFDLPTFVIDAYTTRLCQRYPLEAGQNYSAIKAHFEKSLPRDRVLYNRFHALIVINAKEHCRKRPLCTNCPLEHACAKVI